MAVFSGGERTTDLSMDFASYFSPTFSIQSHLSPNNGQVRGSIFRKFLVIPEQS